METIRYEWMIKICFLIYQPKHMLWVTKRVVSMRCFLWAPKKNVNIYNFRLNFFCLSGPMMVDIWMMPGKLQIKAQNTVIPVLSNHSKLDKTKVLMANGSLMKVESIAECSPWSILQYLWPALRDNRSWKPIFGLLLSGCFRQVLL